MPKLMRPKVAKRKLTNLDVNFVSLVTQGANPGANIVMIKEFNMDNEKSGISVNIDESTLTGILQKGLTDLFASKDSEGGLSTEAIQKAVSGVLGEVSTTISAAVETAVAKAMETKKAEEDTQKADEDADKACGGGKKKDMTKEDEDADKACGGKRKKSLEDESITFNGVTLSKSIIGEDAFNGIIAIQKELAKSQHEALLKSLEVEVEKSYPNLPGSARDKAVLLNTINQMPEGIAKMAKDYFAKANENMGTVVNKSVGTTTDQPDCGLRKEAEDKLDALAKGIMEKENLSYADAYTKALTSPEGTALYEQYCNN